MNTQFLNFTIYCTVLILYNQAILIVTSIVLIIIIRDIRAVPLHWCQFRWDCSTIASVRSVYTYIYRELEKIEFLYVLVCVACCGLNSVNKHHDY